MSDRISLEIALAAAIVMVCVPLPTPAHAQDCTELNGTNYSQGEMYALFGRNGTRKIVRLGPSPYSRNELDFDPKVRLIYAVDGRPNGPPGWIRRDFAGVMAVRLVSTSSDANRRLRPPSSVNLQRDAIAKRGSNRAAWSNEVSAVRYYVYHHPNALRSSDSFLEREFHTEYTYREGEPDRKTYEPRDRRRQFHFPEMTAGEPTDTTSRLISRIFGNGTALAATAETRFESQIKYYRRVAQPRCITITTQLQAGDDGALKITLTDLDHPHGLQGNSETWTITWKTPAALASTRH
jgi:hypothetical protein